MRHRWRSSLLLALPLLILAIASSALVWNCKRELDHDYRRHLIGGGYEQKGIAHFRGFTFRWVDHSRSAHQGYGIRYHIEWLDPMLDADRGVIREVVIEPFVPRPRGFHVVE